MYCRCGSNKEMKKLQEKQEWQGVGETVTYYNCTACTRNHVPDSEKKKFQDMSRREK